MSARGASLNTMAEPLFADYEIVGDNDERVPWVWLIIIALVLWGGAWWLGKSKPTASQLQGETTTSYNESTPAN